MKRITKILIAISTLVILVILIAPLFLVYQIYQESFGEPVETPDALAYPFDEFPEMNVEEFVIERDDNQDLYTYLMTSENDGVDPSALIVLSPGLGGAAEFYTPLIDYLVQSGYNVLTYDPSGHDKTAEADGEGFGSFSQGMKDADDVLTYVNENHEDFDSLPIVAMGHSWGGYSLGGALEWHPEINVAVLFAAFDRPGLLMDAETEAMSGPVFATILKPYYRIYEFINNGKYARQTVVDGVTNAETPTLMLHSEDDEITDGPLSFDIFEEELSSLDWVDIVVDEDRGHSFLYYGENDRDFFAPFDTIDESEIEAQSEGFERPSSVEIDEEYMTQVVEFIEENIE